MSEKKVFYSQGDDPKMIEAFQRAQETFKYFWREQSWEFRRIIPALDLSCVKVAFTQEVEGSTEPIVEHMWINEIGFDGKTIKGILINEPNELTNVAQGDSIEVPVSQISDWLLSSQGKTYGGFTIHLLRSEMDEKERKSHDKAWGLDFGDFNDILVVYQQKEHPENLVEHPMSVNMKQSLIDFLKENPAEVTSADNLGYTMLHTETIAGNRTSAEILLNAGADKKAMTKAGQTALDFAIQLNWEHLIPILKD
jgi:uncharacterized protein YegJ (DUF2314 family)